MRKHKNYFTAAYLWACSFFVLLFISVLYIQNIADERDFYRLTADTLVEQQAISDCGKAENAFFYRDGLQLFDGKYNFHCNWEKLEKERRCKNEMPPQYEYFTNLDWEIHTKCNQTHGYGSVYCDKLNL